MEAAVVELPKVERPREGAVLLRESDGVLHWSVTVWLPMGRGRWGHYAVRTRALPSGRIEAIGPNGRKHHLAPDAQQCTCWQERDCIHLFAVRAHAALDAARSDGD